MKTSRVQSEKDAEETHEVLLETERLKRELEEKLAEFENNERKSGRKSERKSEEKLLKMRNVNRKQSFQIYVQCA